MRVNSLRVFESQFSKRILRVNSLNCCFCIVNISKIPTNIQIWGNFVARTLSSFIARRVSGIPNHVKRPKGPRMLKKLIVLSTFNLIMTSTSFGFAPDRAIYGADNRTEVNQVSDPLILKQTKAVALMVRNTRLNSFDQSSYTFSAVSLGHGINLCPGERFAAQPALGECSGFLVAPDTLVTAGHCITGVSDCAQNSWVFNFNSDNNGKIKKSDVYKCSSIVATTQISNDQTFEDYAVIKLDRPVAGATPLQVRKRGKVRSRSKVYVIGHPDGIPMKVSGSARALPFVRFNFSFGEDFGLEKHDLYQNRKDVFTANLDTFAGNSGSPVFNKRSGKVEGILVEGEDDYEFDMNQGCNRSTRMKNRTFGVGEVVQRITKIPANLLQ